MDSPTQSTPILIYDGDCSFCRIWIDYWKSLTGESVRYAPFQQVAGSFPAIPLEAFRKAVQFVNVDGRVFSGAKAVLTALHSARRGMWAFRLYERVPAFSAASEWLYRLVARHRDAFYRLTVLLWGRTMRPPSYRLTRSAFYRGIGLIYLIAFFSLSTQVLGLIGSQGILPVSDFLDAVQRQFGVYAWRLFPTLAWLNASDAALQWMCVSGVVVAIVLIAGVFPRMCAFLLWLLYLSLYNIGQDFLSFQWDVLLLEAGFLTIFFAHFHRPRSSRPSTAILWLIRLLLFRLMFQSGVVKLTSGDASWTNLTALTYHYETQCIPTIVAWYAHQLPLWFQSVSVVVMFFIEIAVPFSVFLPRRPRMAGAMMLIGFQIIIMLTGNYTFFNLLTIVLCLSLFDDAALQHIVPKKFMSRQPVNQARNVPALKRAVLVAFTVTMCALNVVHVAGLFVQREEIPAPMASLMLWSSHYAIVNSYGLFRVMTTSRPEIIVEGSDDGRLWRVYEFKYKAGDTLRPPPWVAPHQPRLDWQMWFAALGSYRSEVWFTSFVVRLLEGSHDVLALLGSNPFPDSPPRYIRALLYEYRFTDVEERRATGAYWRREYKGIYLPPISLRRKEL